MSPVTKAQIIQYYVRLFSISPTGVSERSVNYWCNAINSGGKTWDDFRVFLLSSAEYKKKLMARFTEQLLELVPGWDQSLDRSVDFFNEMMTSYGRSAEIDDSMIRQFIKTKVPAYREQVSDIIKNMAELVMVTRPDMLTDDIRRSLLDKFCAESSHQYGIDDLRMDLERLDKVDDVSIAPVAPAPNEDAELSPPPSSTDGGFVRNVRQLLALHYRHYGRPMFVEEYLRVAPKLGDDFGPDAIGKIVRESFAHYVDCWKAARHAWGVHLDEDMDEYLFVRLHYDPDKDPSETESIVADAVLAGTAYHERIRVLATAVFKQKYDYDMDDNLLRFLFDTIRSNRIGLRMTEELHSFIKKFKEICDDIAVNVDAAYAGVYNRAPSHEELRSWTAYYLQKQSESVARSQCDEELMISLSHDLEYHDVIKKHIREAWPGPEDISNGVLFKVLAGTLEETKASPRMMPAQILSAAARRAVEAAR